MLALLSRDGLLHRFAAAAADSWRQLRELLALAQRWECVDEQMYGLLVDAPRLAEAVAAWVAEMRDAYDGQVRDEERRERRKDS